MGERPKVKRRICAMELENAEGGLEGCGRLHAREKVSGTIIKRRRLCECKRLGEVIINVKLNSNI